MTTVRTSSAWETRFLTILDLGLHHYTFPLSHLALSKLVAVGHLSQLAQCGVLPFNQLVQLLGLQNESLIQALSNTGIASHWTFISYFNVQQRLELTSRSLVPLDSVRP